MLLQENNNTYLLCNRCDSKALLFAGKTELDTVQKYSAKEKLWKDGWKNPIGQDLCNKCTPFYQYNYLTIEIAKPWKGNVDIFAWEYQIAVLRHKLQEVKQNLPPLKRLDHRELYA